jgi:hypothetical protein
VWLPETTKCPLEPETVPTEEVPSPQLMVAVESLGLLAVSISVKEATAPEKERLAVAGGALVVVGVR